MQCPTKCTMYEKDTMNGNICEAVCILIFNVYVSQLYLTLVLNEEHYICDHIW